MTQDYSSLNHLQAADEARNRGQDPSVGAAAQGRRKHMR